MRLRRIPIAVALETYRDPDGTLPGQPEGRGSREIRWRRYDQQVVEIVVDTSDGAIVSAWITRVQQ